MKDFLASLVRSRTMIFAALLAALGVIETQFRLIAHLIPAELHGLVLIVIAVAVAVLRVVTTKPLSER